MLRKTIPLFCVLLLALSLAVPSSLAVGKGDVASVADIVYRDDRVTAFRDINPQAPVHVLIVPNKEIGTVNDITPAEPTSGVTGNESRATTRTGTGKKPRKKSSAKKAGAKKAAAKKKAEEGK